MTAYLIDWHNHVPVLIFQTSSKEFPAVFLRQGWTKGAPQWEKVPLQCRSVTLRVADSFWECVDVRIHGVP